MVNILNYTSNLICPLRVFRCKNNKTINDEKSSYIFRRSCTPDRSIIVKQKRTNAQSVEIALENYSIIIVWTKIDYSERLIS